jgi:hypothetical protein
MQTYQFQIGFEKDSIVPMSPNSRRTVSAYLKIIYRSGDYMFAKIVRSGFSQGF